jgi:hypothetical protein
MRPAVVIAAHNRPDTLMRLLACIERARYPADVPLIISIDPGGSREREVYEAAQGYAWPHGEKHVTLHKQHLGLVEHVYFTAGLSEKYGAVIRLEDDYYVSPMYYEYTSQALEYYRDDQRIAGISLYSVWFNGYTHEPFTPYLDAGDVYFMQSPWSQGQAFTANQWRIYTDWRISADRRLTPGDPIHEVYLRFAADDWFPMKTKYLAETGRFYAFPRESLCTNFGDAGTHFDQASNYFQVPLQTLRREFRFQPLDEAVAVYDSFHEMLPDRLNRLDNTLASYDYEVDLSGVRSAAKIRRPYVLTTKPCRDPIRTFGCVMHPREANIAAGVPGTDIALCRASDVQHNVFAHWQLRSRAYDYALRRYAVSMRDRLLFRLMKLLR